MSGTTGSQDGPICSGPFEPDCPVAHRSPEEYDRIHSTGIDSLIDVANEVINRWEHGDLAEATNALTTALDRMKGPMQSALDRKIAAQARDAHPCYATEMLRGILSFRCKCDQDGYGPGECPVHDPHTSLEDSADDLYQIFVDTERKLLAISELDASVAGSMGLMQKLYESRLSACERRAIQQS